MTLLTPLGLLGLLGVVALIIIYIIKPNFQNKYVSSTYVWKLSLKYRKRKIPTSKLRNILLIICQVLILVSCALILAQPNLILKQQIKETEVIAIIDSSASMRTECADADYIDQTRFEKAVEEVKILSDEVFSENGFFSVILADANSTYLQYRINLDTSQDLDASLDELLKGDTACSFGSSNMDAAIDLCEEVLDENPYAEIVIYTDSEYISIPDGIKVVNLANSEEGKEWNAGILDAYAELYEGFYVFNVDIATYGRSETVKLCLDIYGANPSSDFPDGFTYPFDYYINCIDGETMRVVFMEWQYVPAITEENTVYVPITQDIYRTFSYSYVHIYLGIDETNDEDFDSFTDDNQFFIYDGRKEQVKIQYTSSDPGIFFPAALGSLQSNNINNWDIDITQIKKGSQGAVSGFDFYVFENTIPSAMPEDGVVLLVNPTANSNVLSSAGISYLSSEDLRANTEPFYISVNEEKENHPILNKITSGSITLSYYSKLQLDNKFETLLTCNGDPVLAVKNEGKTKIVVFAFGFDSTSLAISNSAQMLISNTFNYFCPITVSGNAFEVNEIVSLNARGAELTLSGYDYVKGDYINEVFDTFPATFTLSTPGTYSLTQVTDFDKEVVQNIYVKIPAAESNIFKVEESIKNPIKNTDTSNFFSDLLFYIAVALIALLFIEWWLQSRENM